MRPWYLYTDFRYDHPQDYRLMRAYIRAMTEWEFGDIDINLPERLEKDDGPIWGDYK